MMQTLGRDNVFVARERVGESGLEALHEAQKWIDTVSGDDDADSDSNDLLDSNSAIDSYSE